jgi:hypothetical protein
MALELIIKMLPLRAMMIGTCLINRNEVSRTTSSRAKARVFLRFYVGAEAGLRKPAPAPAATIYKMASNAVAEHETRVTGHVLARRGTLL